jgi:hypothetical protein
MEIKLGPWEINIEHKREHGECFLLASLGPFTNTGESSTMPAQALTIQNTAAPSITSFKVGPFEKFNAAGDDEGPDSLAVVVTSSDTTQATVVADGDGTSTVTLLPDTDAGFTLTFSDVAAGGTAAGSIVVTVLAPAPDNLVATIGAPVVTG